MRMREWQDLHAQLHDALEELGTVHLNESNAAYDAIHRSILTGLLGHVAMRAERNRYQAAGNRQLVLFPGSATYERSWLEAARGKKQTAGAKSEPQAVTATGMDSGRRDRRNFAAFRPDRGRH